MIDALDKQTQALPFEPEKRGRGRPKTGSAMTPAEKQRAYRERQKAASGNVTENSQDEKIRAELEKLKLKVIELLSENLALREERIVLKKELESRKVVTKKPQKTYVAALQKLSAKGQWRTVIKYESNMEAATQMVELQKDNNDRGYRIKALK